MCQICQLRKIHLSTNKITFFQLKPMFLFLWFCYICGFVLGYSSWMNQIDCYSIQHISIFKRFRICVKFFKPRLLAWKMLKNSSPTAEGWRYRIKVFGIALQRLWWQVLKLTILPTLLTLTICEWQRQTTKLSLKMFGVQFKKSP